MSADGSELLFQSGYSLSDEAPPVPGTSVYRHRADVPETLLRVDSSAAGTTVYSVFVSDDGRTRGWTTTTACSTRLCQPPEPNRTALTLIRDGRLVPVLTGSDYYVGRNGRWIVQTSIGGLPPGPTGGRYDADTGVTVQLPNFRSLAHPTHAIADDGSVLASTGLGLGVYGLDGNGPVVFPESGDVRTAAITRDGRKVLAMTDTTLYEMDRATLARTDLYTVPGGGLRAFSPSALGDRVLILSGREILLAGAGAVTRIYTAPEDVRQILLTGDGRTGFVLTQLNRVVRIQADGAEELYAPLPPPGTRFSEVLAPGSLLQMFGGPFRDGQTLTVDGVEFPVVAIEDGKFEAQIPWEYDYRSDRRYALRTPGHPFVVTGSLPGLPFSEAPGMYRNEKLTDAYTVKAALADFRSLLSVENPAPAGSTIHFWLTGLGPLDRTLATGERGPSNPPAKPIAPFACYLQRSDDVPAMRGLEIPFAAYGPGLLGVYQVDVVIPADWPSGPSTLVCAVDDQWSNHGHGRIYVK